MLLLCCFALIRVRTVEFPVLHKKINLGSIIWIAIIHRAHSSKNAHHRKNEIVGLWILSEDYK